MNVQPTGLGQSLVIQDNKRISWEDALRELAATEASAEDARAAARWARAGSIAWFGSGAVVGLGIGAIEDSRTVGWALVGGGVAMLAGGAWGWSMGTRHMDAAVTKYNSAIAQPAPTTSSGGVHIEPWLSAVAAGNRPSCPVVGATLSF